MTKTSSFVSVITLMMSSCALSSVIEPEDTYEKYVGHYQSGYYSQLSTDFVLDTDSQQKSAGTEVSAIDEKNAPNSEDSKLNISGNEYDLSELEKIGLERLFAQKAREYRACVKREETDCYTNEIFHLQSMLGIYDGGMDDSRPKFTVRSTSTERRFAEKGNGVLYQWTMEFSEETGLVVNDFCFEGRLKESQKRWTTSDKNCARPKAWGEYLRSWYKASLTSAEYKDIPFKFSRSDLQSGKNRTEFVPCRVIGTARCAKANRLLKKQDWIGLKSFAENHESESYLWKFYKSQANFRLGETKAAVSDLKELISSFPTSTYFSAQTDWERFVKFAASTLISHYYVTGDYQSVADCCHIMGTRTEGLGLDDLSTLNAQLMRASAMTLIERPRVGTALAILLDLKKTLDVLDLSEDASVRADVDQQLAHLRRQLEGIGRRVDKNQVG